LTNVIIPCASSVSEVVGISDKAGPQVIKKIKSHK